MTTTTTTTKIVEHITFPRLLSAAPLAARLGIHTNYYDARFYVVPFDITLAPASFMIIHFDQTDYPLQRAVHNQFFSMPHVKMCLALINTHDHDPVKLRAGALLDHYLKHPHLSDCFALIPAGGAAQPLSQFDF